MTSDEFHHNPRRPEAEGHALVAAVHDRKAAADAAYTQAVQRAAQTGDWTLVPAAHQAVHQARAQQEVETA